jgi:hypothetical protein
MKRGKLFSAAASIVLVAGCIISTGCSDSTGPSEPGPSYPDIEGLVVFYNFDGNYENETSEAHGGAATRAVTFVDGRPRQGGGSAGQAIHVETNDYVAVPDHADFDITSDVTVAAWVNPEASDRSVASIVCKGYAEAYGLAMWGGIADPETTNIYAYVNGGSRSSEYVVPMGMDIWSHIGFTYSTSTGRVRHYFNGAKIDSGTLAGPMVVSDDDLQFGYKTQLGGYKGSIDEVAIFDRALTEEEMHALYEYE